MTEAERKARLPHAKQSQICIPNDIQNHPSRFSSSRVYSLTGVLYIEAQGLNQSPLERY